MLKSIPTDVYALLRVRSYNMVILVVWKFRRASAKIYGVPVGVLSGPYSVSKYKLFGRSHLAPPCH